MFIGEKIVAPLESLFFFPGLCSLVAVGLFLDHYIWELDANHIFISSTELDQDNALTIGDLAFTSFEYLIITEGYHFVPRFQYSFYLEVAGPCPSELYTRHFMICLLQVPVFHCWSCCCHGV